MKNIKVIEFKEGYRGNYPVGVDTQVNDFIKNNDVVALDIKYVAVPDNHYDDKVTLKSSALLIYKENDDNDA